MTTPTSILVSLDGLRICCTALEDAQAIIDQSTPLTVLDTLSVRRKIRKVIFALHQDIIQAEQPLLDDTLALSQPTSKENAP